MFYFQARSSFFLLYVINFTTTALLPSLLTPPHIRAIRMPEPADSALVGGHWPFAVFRLRNRLAVGQLFLVGEVANVVHYKMSDISTTVNGMRPYFNSQMSGIADSTFCK